MRTERRSVELYVLGGLVVAGEVLLGIAPRTDRVTWLLENLPVFAGLPLVLIYQPRLQLTPLLLRLLTGHAFVLMVGGHYSYAQVPLGFWMQSAFGFARNHYDRIGHLMQGLVPALLVRELLLRFSALRRGWLLGSLAVCVALAGSAVYELLEWGAAVALGQGADAFLGTQGDPWDTQGDMAMALVGALVAVLAVAPLQDRALRKRPEWPATLK